MAPLSLTADPHRSITRLAYRCSSEGPSSSRVGPRPPVPNSHRPRAHGALSTPLPSAVGALSTPVKAAASRSRPILPPPAGLRARAPSCACHPGSAARSMVSTRRSARRGGNGPLAADGAPSELAPDAPPPPSVRRRQSRDASPPGWPGRAREKASFVISNDDKLKQPVGADKQDRQGRDIVVVEEPDEMDEDSRSLEEPPGWLPDGWIMEHYTSPVSGYTFTSKMETIEYLFSGMEERMLESQGSHTWLPGGWLIEVRAGGKKMDKMYKFYFHPPSGMRFLSKGEVLRYVNEGKISACDMDLLCDTSTDDNILALVEFSPDGLPDGWVKETIFRKCNDGIRKDPYYTDPISHRVFRTLKSVLSYLGTGEISKHAYLPRRNVIDMYSFDKCADLPQSMLKRLKAEGQTKHKSRRALVLNKELPNDQTSNHSLYRIMRWLHCLGCSTAEGGLTPKSDPKGNKFGNEKGTSTHEIGSETTIRRRGRPKKILKQTNESISDRDRRHNETKHNEVKEEVDIGVEEGMPNGKTKEHTEMLECTTVIQELENNSSIAERNLSRRKGDESDLVACPGLESQENGRLTKAGEKATCTSVYKFYKRRCSNQMLGSNKG
ncbi:uncharacterized protein LOC120639658 isoform X5 [Panicum virgatum]|uniref:uncharacterized protein LOC120639658 isoform X5 n=1 Tax=Panicum virgatum TaxID=38727 RepID=UPI0019D686EF|nr:uncharacterized protein LOC120639658 isoform X5 [Panicum virgatum]